MEELMKSLNNYFYAFKETNTFTIENNTIKNLKGTYFKGQYIRIINSILNTGVYRVASFENGILTITEDLVNETFTGVIAGLAVPKTFIDIVKKIEEYDLKIKDNTLVSESFVDYSYTKVTDGNGNVATGRDVYKSNLKAFRRLNDGLRYVKEVS